MSDDRRNRWLYSIAGVLTAAAVGLFLFTTASSSELPTVTVYKSAACVCCGGWVEHMEDAGFDVDVVEDRNLMAVKADRRVPSALHSCHTATVDGFTVEGHVPAADVKRMLQERPPVVGIGVGGMPTGSPGMPGIPEPYAVEAFSGDGATAVYAEH
jgi:hypothetical protein